MAQSTGHNQRPEGSDEGRSVLFFSNTLMSDIEADWSPILDAAYNGRVLVLRNLIAQGACANTATLDRVSPLFGACLLGHSTCAKLLLDNGANVNSPTLGQTTALSEASARGHTACVTLLLQNGATPQGSAYSDSPIHQAAAKGHLKCIEILVHHGADVDQHIDQSGSPLYTACTNQHLSTVRTLLQLGASVNGSQDRESPLHAAARLSSAELVSVLLEHGADRSSRDARGRRAADLAPHDSPAERLLRHSGGVPCLMKLCRLLIRKVLGKKRLREISGLHIPLELKLYLQYQSNQWGTCIVCPPIPKQYNFSPIGGALASPVEKSSEP